MSIKTYKNAVPTTKASKVITPQSAPIPGREKEMVRNYAGGFVFSVDEFTQLDRFLILGTEGGSYHASERKLTEAAAKSVVKAIQNDGIRAVNRIVEVSVAGRAPKNDPALYALALAMTYGDDATKTAAYDAIPKVARIGTHLFHLAEYVNNLRGWGRGLRKGFSRWYNEKTPMQLAHQMTKYANRDGWTHRDILRLAHVSPATPTHDALFTNAVGKAKAVDIDLDVAAYMSAIEELRSLDRKADGSFDSKSVKAAVKLINDFKLPREVVPTELLNERLVWEAMLPHMGMEALVRNLATMTRNGLIAPLSDTKKLILDKMKDEDQIKKSRLHPIKALSALLTYGRGHGAKGGNTWTPDRNIVDALDEMFYATFQNIIPTNKKLILALDCSASMTWHELAGISGLTPRIASAAMCMVTARTEAEYEVIGFSSGTASLKRIGITPRMRLDQAIAEIQKIPMGGTDCALPMIWATQNKIPADAFAVYTDNETWAGQVQPVQALREHRRVMGNASKLIVVGMESSGFSIADPTDAGMMDVVGFDSAAPSLMADFIRGDF
jgi:60 kDa SS-A/Ro ribonucleoprotein